MKTLKDLMALVSKLKKEEFDGIVEVTYKDGEIVSIDQECAPGVVVRCPECGDEVCRAYNWGPSFEMEIGCLNCEYFLKINAAYLDELQQRKGQQA